MTDWAIRSTDKTRDLSHGQGDWRRAICNPRILVSCLHPPPQWYPPWRTDSCPAACACSHLPGSRRHRSGCPTGRTWIRRRAVRSRRRHRQCCRRDRISSVSGAYADRWGWCTFSRTPCRDTVARWCEFSCAASGDWTAWRRRSRIYKLQRMKDRRWDKLKRNQIFN